MNGVKTTANQYTFGYAIYRPDEDNAPRWLLYYNLGWNLAWNQYSPGTYNIVVTATDEWGASSTVSTTAAAYPPINAVGSGYFAYGDHNIVYTDGFYTELYSCGFACYYFSGYALDHYGAAVSATLSGPYYDSYRSTTWFNVDAIDNMGSIHHSAIFGKDKSGIKSYLSSTLGIPVS